MVRPSPLSVIFFRIGSGNEPVREWLKSPSRGDRQRIGIDIWKIQLEWPVGMPHVRPLGGGLHEIRSSLRDGIARVIFSIDRNNAILLHGFIKKSQKMPLEELTLARTRKRLYEQKEN